MFRFEEGTCYRMPAHFGGTLFDAGAEHSVSAVPSSAFQ